MCVYLHECLPQVGPLLDQLPMFFEEGTQEQAEVLDEVLLVVFPVRVCQTDVRVQRQHLRTQPENELTSNLHGVTSCTRSVLAALQCARACVCVMIACILLPV